MVITRSIYLKNGLSARRFISENSDPKPGCHLERRTPATASGSG